MSTVDVNMFAAPPPFIIIIYCLTSLGIKRASQRGCFSEVSKKTASKNCEDFEHFLSLKKISETLDLLYV